MNDKSSAPSVTWMFLVRNYQGNKKPGAGPGSVMGAQQWHAMMAWRQRLWVFMAAATSRLPSRSFSVGRGADMGGGGGQGADVGAEQEQLVATDGDVSFRDLHAGVADRFDFPTYEHDAGFETVLDEVVKKCFFIICYGHEFGKSTINPYRVG